MNILDSFSKEVRICEWKNKYLDSSLKAFRNRKRKNKYYRFLRISYCARNSHVTSVIQREQIIGQMAIAITLRGLNDLGRLATPIFLSMSHFLYRFFTFCEKISRNLNVLQNAPSNSVHLTSSFSFAAVSNASSRVTICENNGNI